jgi:hypothetical protein
LPPLLVLALAHCSRARGMGSAAGGSDGWNGRMDGRMHAGNHAAPGKGPGGLLTHRGYGLRSEALLLPLHLHTATWPVETIYISSILLYLRLPHRRCLGSV